MFAVTRRTHRTRHGKSRAILIIDVDT